MNVYDHSDLSIDSVALHISKCFGPYEMIMKVHVHESYIRSRRGYVMTVSVLNGNAQNVTCVLMKGVA